MFPPYVCECTSPQRMKSLGQNIVGCTRGPAAIRPVNIVMLLGSESLGAELCSIWEMGAIYSHNKATSLPAHNI